MKFKKDDIIAIAGLVFSVAGAILSTISRHGDTMKKIGESVNETNKKDAQ